MNRFPEHYDIVNKKAWEPCEMCDFQALRLELLLLWRRMLSRPLIRCSGLFNYGELFWHRCGNDANEK